jgi:glucose-6-phosphate 1-dehydrogenase
MVQNHLTQVLTLIAMEVPAAFEADAIRYEKAKVLRATQPIGKDDVIFGQYARGKIDGREVPGYAEEPGMPRNAKSETYVALRLYLDTWRWQGVPFYLRTGKRLERRVTQIAVNFRRPPVCLFESLGSCQVHSNVLVMTLQPDEGFALYFDVKRPGEPFALETLPLDFRYGEAFGAIPEAYETLLLDVLTGNQMLFVHADEVQASWRLYTPLLEAAIERHPYAAGSWGPEAASRFFPRPPR